MMGNCDSTVTLFIYEQNYPCCLRLSRCLFAYNQQATEYENTIKIHCKTLPKKNCGFREHRNQSGLTLFR